MARGEDREQLLQEVSDLDQQLHSFVANNSTEYGEPQEEVKGCKRFLKALQQVKNITIEPILFLYLLSWTIQSSISTNLLLDKVSESFSLYREHLKCFYLYCLTHKM